MSLRTFSWRKVFHYGEVVGFVLAWIVGLVVAAQTRSTDRGVVETQRVASANGPGANGLGEGRVVNTRLRAFLP